MPVNKITKTKITDLVSSDYMMYLRDFALANGIAAKTLVENSDGDLSLLINPPHLVSERIFHQFGFNMFNAFDNPYTKVIEFGRGLNLSSHGSLGMAIQGACNLKEVAQLAQQYYSTRANSHFIELIERDNYISVRLSLDDSEYDSYFSMFSLVNFENTVTKLLTKHKLDNKCVIHLKISEPKDFPWHLIERFDLKFKQKNNQLQVPKSWMGLSISPIDPELANLAKNQCDEALEKIKPQDLVSIIRQKLKLIKNKNISLKEMADLLFISPSTLQRRLRAFDTTYKDIKLEVRLLEAKHLLSKESHTIEFISEQLGFSDASSFTKSFRTFCGMTPANYRKGQQTDDLH